MSRNNLAVAYRDAGDLGRAIPLFERVLGAQLRVLGQDHPHTLISRDNLALAYQESGDLGRAIPLFEQALTHWGRVLGQDHPNTVMVRDNLAVAYRDAGDLGRAIPLFEQALSDSVRVLGADHPQTKDRARQPRRGAPASSVVPRPASALPGGGRHAGGPEAFSQRSG